MKKTTLVLILTALSFLGFSQSNVPQPVKVTNTTSLSTTDRGYIDGIEGSLTAINENTLASLGVSSQITYTTAFVTKSSGGTLYGCFGYNSKTTGQWIQFFNLTAIPADAVAPFIAAIYVPALSPFSFDTGKYGIPFSTGITWSNSSTPQTKTIGSSDIQITVIYK